MMTVPSYPDTTCVRPDANLNKDMLFNHGGSFVKDRHRHSVTLPRLYIRTWGDIEPGMRYHDLVSVSHSRTMHIASMLVTRDELRPCLQLAGGDFVCNRPKDLVQLDFQDNSDLQIRHCPENQG
jgi:hypothetical protein